MAKRKSKITVASPATKARKPRATTLYPKITLVDALRLAESIRDNNAGEPYNRIDLAASIDLFPESSFLRTYITASNKFGLTTGSYSAERIGLTDLGGSIVSPTSDEEKAEGLLKALYRVDFYKNFFERFKNHRLPRKDLLLNTLERDFSIPHADREQCYDLLIKNATELGQSPGSGLLTAKSVLTRKGLLMEAGRGSEEVRHNSPEPFTSVPLGGFPGW